MMDVPVSRISNSKRMWAQLTKDCPFILLHHMIIIQMRQSLKRVHGNQYTSCISLEKPLGQLASYSKTVMRMQKKEKSTTKMLGFLFSSEWEQGYSVSL